MPSAAATLTPVSNDLRGELARAEKKEKKEKKNRDGDEKKEKKEKKDRDDKKEKIPIPICRNYYLQMGMGLLQQMGMGYD